MPPLVIGAVALGGAAIAAGGITAAFAAGGLISFAANFGASMLLSGAAQSMMPKPSLGQIELQARTVTVREPVMPRQMVYGRTRKGGVITFLHSTGEKDKDLHLVVVLAAHRVKSIGAVYFEGEMAINAAGTPQGRWLGKLAVEKRLGRSDQSAFAGLIAAAPQLWTSAHRLAGCAAIYLRLTYDPDAFPGGIPNITVNMEGKDDILDWPKMAAEMKRKGVTLLLLWEEYRAGHPDGYGYTWFCERYREFESRVSPRYRNRHEAGAVMQTDYAGHTIPVTDPATGREHRAQIFVAVLGASNYTFAWASLSQKLPDWIDAQVRALHFFGGVPKAIVCDNLKAAVAKPLWFEPSVTKTFSDMATHYDTTVLPTRPRKPRDKGKVEGAVLIVERWILARLRNRQFFSIEALNVAIVDLLADLNARIMRRVGRSRKELFEEVEHAVLRPLPDTPFEYAEWKQAKVHPDYHIEVLHSFYSVPHHLIGWKVDVRLTHRMIEIFHNHERVAVHHRRGHRGGHTTIKEHMPKAHQRHGGMTPESLIQRAARTGYHTAALVERLMRDRPHPEQGYRSALGVLSLQRQFGPERLEAACRRALTVGAVSYAAVRSILVTGLDQAPEPQEPITATPAHDNIRGAGYYQ